MSRVFECLTSDFFKVPVGALINPFLNPKDATSGLPWNSLDGVSITAGQINPGVITSIRIHPFISQVTLLLSGTLTIHRKDPGTADPVYQQQLMLPASNGKSGFALAASLMQPGTFFQLDNSHGTEPANVLYICSPGYIFEPGGTPGSSPRYEDAVTVGNDWQALADQDWNPSILHEPKYSYAARQQAIQRLS